MNIRKWNHNNCDIFGGCYVCTYIISADFTNNILIVGALIFGEGVLNDAISIVLFHVLISNHARDDSNSAAPLQELAMKLILEVTNEVFLSFAIGVSCGLANARLLKSLTYLREHPIHQTVLLLLFAYLAYTIAESVGVSGILTLFVTAVTEGHYTWHSLSKPAQVATKINAVALSGEKEILCVCVVLQYCFIFW